MTKKELKDCWDKALVLMRGRVDQLVINAFLSPLTPYKLSERDQKLYLYAPKESNYAFYQNSVKNYTTDLTYCLNEVFGKPYSVEVTEKETDQDTEDIFSAEDSLAEYVLIKVKPCALVDVYSAESAHHP